MLEKTGVPEIRFAGFTNTWEQRKLIDISEIVTGMTPPTKDKDNYGGEKLFVSPADIQGNRSVDNTITTLTEKGFNLGRKLRPGTSLFVSIGSTIGKVAQIKDFATTNQQINAVIPFEFMDDDYIFSMLEKEADKIKKLSAQQAVPIINKSTFGGIEIMYPAKEEQVKIGNYFLYFDHLIILQQHKYTLLCNIKKSMLEKMFPRDGATVPEVRFAGFTGAWEQRKLGEVGSTYTGLDGKTKEDFGHGSGRFVTYMNVFTNPVSDVTTVEPIEIDKSQNEVRFGDVLFTTSSETPEEVGMSSVWLENSENTYLNSFCFGFRPTERFDPYYLAYMLRSEDVRKKITFLAQGISRYNISKSKMMDIEIPIPKEEEQRLLGTFFRHVDQLITLHHRELERLQNIKKSCLEKMFV